MKGGFKEGARYRGLVFRPPEMLFRRKPGIFPDRIFHGIPFPGISGIPSFC